MKYYNSDIEIKQHDVIISNNKKYVILGKPDMSHVVFFAINLNAFLRPERDIHDYSHVEINRSAFLGRLNMDVLINRKEQILMFIEVII